MAIADFTKRLTLTDQPKANESLKDIARNSQTNSSIFVTVIQQLPFRLIIQGDNLFDTFTGRPEIPVESDARITSLSIPLH